MTLHLLVVGERTSPDDDIDPVADQVTARGGDPFVMRRCRSPHALVKVIRDVVIERGMLIDTLDLYDHAARDHVRMGDATLFDIAGKGVSILRSIRPFLTPDARVRLLGCETAQGEEGRELLKMLCKELGGGVVVYGTLGTITETLFVGGLFRWDKEMSFLFSSTEASLRVAPSWEDRQREIATFLRAHRT